MFDQKANKADVDVLKERVKMLEEQRDLLVTFTTAQVKINQDFRESITRLVEHMKHMEALLVEAGVLQRVESDNRILN